jgi:hypothetical protein
MSSIAGCALERKDVYDRSSRTRSNAPNYSKIPTVQGWKRWRIGPARATTRDMGLRGMRSILLLAFDRSVLDHTIVRSIALVGTPHFSLSQFCPLWSCIECNDLQHQQDTKTTQMLDINNTKRLTNIS